MISAPVLASLGDTVESFLGAANDFFTHLATINWFALIVALGCFGMYLLLRSRALVNALRAAYPDEEVKWGPVWGGYVIAYGLNNFVPASAGNVAQYYLTKNSIRNSTYPTVTTALATGAVLDAAVSTLVIAFAFTQGIFPKPSDFADVGSFDLAFIGRNPEVTLFVVTALLVAGLTGIAILSVRVHAFWARVRQGITILRDRRRYAREMVTWQLGAWAFRFGTWWLMLRRLPHRRVTAQRPARAGGAGDLGGVAGDARRRGRAAGAVRRRVLRVSPRTRRWPRTRSASRSLCRSSRWASRSPP